MLTIRVRNSDKRNIIIFFTLAVSLAVGVFVYGNYLTPAIRPADEIVPVPVYYDWYCRAMITTAYNSILEQTDSEPCLAADGENICELYAAGQLVCASNAFPLGTILRVEDYGECTVLDRMNSRYTDRVDVYMGLDVAQARVWGKRMVEVCSLGI